MRTLDFKVWLLSLFLCTAPPTTAVVINVNHAAGYTAAMNGHKEITYLDGCEWQDGDMQDITDAMALNQEPEPDEEPKETLETLETEPEPEPESKETKVTEASTEVTHKPPRKRWITKDDAEEITKRYRAGEDMLKIADDLNLLRAQVSRFIATSKLGQERYKGKIPSNGGAPIPTCEVSWDAPWAAE